MTVSETMCFKYGKRQQERQQARTKTDTRRWRTLEPSSRAAWFLHGPPHKLTGHRERRRCASSPEADAVTKREKSLYSRFGSSLEVGR